MKRSGLFSAADVTRSRLCPALPSHAHETGIFRAYDANGEAGTLVGVKDAQEGVSYAYFKVFELTASDFNRIVSKEAFPRLCK
jgi:hypothetical protein